MQGKPWRCENRHVMGMVHRGRNGIRHLRLWRVAAQPGDVICIIDRGLVRDIRCAVCGSVRTWHPDDEALHDLLRKNVEETVEK